MTGNFYVRILHIHHLYNCNDVKPSPAEKLNRIGK